MSDKEWKAMYELAIEQRSQARSESTRLRAECDALRAEVAALQSVVRGKIVVRKVWVDDDGDIRWELVDAALKEVKE